MIRRDSSYATYASIGISIVVIVYVASKLNRTDMLVIFSNIQWGWIMLALCAFFLNYILRTIRFRALIFSFRIPFKSLFSTITLYGMYNYLLPAKSGELTYLYLLKRRHQINLTESTSTLLAARFFDFAVIAMFLPIVVIALRQQLQGWIVISALVFSALIYLILVGGVFLIRRFNFDKDSFPIPRNRLVLWFSDFTRRLLRDIQAVYLGGKFWFYLGLTSAIWFCVYANFYLIVRGLGFPINFIQIIVVSIILVPLTLLPVQGVANLGTHELGWVATFSIFGYPSDVALNIAVGTHVVLLVFVVLLAGLGFFIGLIPSSEVIILGQQFDEHG